MKRVVKWLVILAVLGAAGYFGYQYYLSQQTPAVAVESGYTQVAVARGNLEKSVTGTGTLSISQTQDVALDFAVTLSEVLVSAGDAVAEGQPLFKVDADALQATIDALQVELTTAEETIASLSAEYSSTEVARYGIAGRVKQSYLETGRQLEDIMAEHGALVLLSLDKTMRVEVPAGDFAIGDTVKIRSTEGTAEGSVVELTGDTAVISFSDAFALEGETVHVLNAAFKELATGTATIHTPYWVTSTAKGYISIAYGTLNARVTSSSRLAYLTNVPTSEEYFVQLKERERLNALMSEAKQLLQDGTICAPVAGVVQSASAAGQAEQAAHTVLATLYVGDAKQMVVSVDELDITGVAVGQEADLVMDAISDKTYSATVSYVSQIGVSSSGVTVYDVTLDIDGDDQLKIGMNGTATIKIEQVNDVLLVPIAALNSSRDGQYVWLASDAAEGDEPGVKTFVTTGLSDEDFAEVTSGLSEGDEVMLTREAVTNAMQNGFGGMMMDFGGSGMPAGAPSGGGERPSGGFSGGGR